MLLKENEEENKLINLEEYYSNFFYKNKKFKQSFKSKMLDLREYFSLNPKIHFAFDILIGTIVFGFPLLYLVIYRQYEDIKSEKFNFFSFMPLLIISIFTLTIILIIFGMKIRRISKTR
jgi:hypothetical protein